MSCGPSPKGDKAKAPGSRTQRDINFPTQDVDVCSSKNVLDIARDGRTIVSSFNKINNLKRSGIITWDLYTKSIKAKYAFDLRIEKTSPNGSYFIRKISQSKLQILGFKDEFVAYNVFLPINSMKKIDVDFSQDSRYLMIRSTPYGASGMDQFDIFDIRKRQFYKSFRGFGIKFMKMTSDSNTIVMGYDNGYEKFIALYNFKDFVEIQKIKLPRYGNFSFLESAMDRIIIKSDRKFFAFNTTSGQLVFEEDFQHFHDVSVSGRYALVQKNHGEFGVVDLQSGTTEFTRLIPTQAEISTCQLSESPLQLICRDKVNLGHVYILDVESEKSVSVCI